ncbi:MAG: MFS transporter [Planctomycetota bacterium]
MANSIQSQPTGSNGSENSVWSLSFQCLLWTNWLTAINDNVFRWFVIAIGKDFAEAAAASSGNGTGFRITEAFVLAIGTASFVLPYILFAVPAGWLADRFSKRQVIVGCKVLEVIVMAIGVLAVWMGNIWLLLFVVFLMGLQSALMAPAKVGKIPELLDETKISLGNGFFTLATLSATIIGMVVGGWLADVTGRFGQERLWLTTLVLVGNAIVGTLIALLIRKHAAANPGLPLPWNFFGATWSNLVALYRSGPLFRVALGIVFYWSFAALGQLNIDTFASENGSILESERTPMLVSLVLGVGLGSVLAGLASSGKIELGLVPWATVGMIVFATLLGFAPAWFLIPPAGASSLLHPQHVIACLLLAGLGISAGFFDVPLASYLQDRSPEKSRGSILAASNFMLFTGVLLTSLCFYPLRQPSQPGNYSALPAVYTGEPLSAADRGELDRQAASFREQWRAADEAQRPDPAALAAGNRPLLSRLIWEDLQLRRETDPRLDLQAYVDRFPEDQQRMVRMIERMGQSQPRVSARGIFLMMGALTIPVLLFAAWRLSKEMVRILLWWILRTLYRMRVTGEQNVPEKGPALLISNHSSWMDGAIVLLMTHRRPRAIAWAGNFQSGFARWFANFAGVILISGGPKSILKGIREARAALENGELLCVFPEGGLSRTVQLQTFKPGILKIIEGLDVPVVPVYIDQMWGSLMSYSGGKAFWKIPTAVRRPLSVSIGEPIQPPHDLFQLRQAVQKLSADCVVNRVGRFSSPAERFVRMCRRRLFRLKLNDSTSQKMTGGQLLMRALILRRLLRKHLLATSERHVGVLIPPSSGGVVVNMALALDRRVAVNLNYTVSNEIMNHCIRHAEIKHVLTTAKVLEKFDFKFESELGLLDDLRAKLSLSDKLASAAMAYICPAWLTVRLLGLTRNRPDDLLTIIFTSGSTGTPKGVQLTQQNISSNIDGVDQVISLKREDTIAGILPFFHSFGYTISLWGPMCLNIQGVYHFSPLDARVVGKLVQENAATILLATPTFLRTFMKRCTPEEFKTLEVVVVGAEKMPSELAEEFEQKYGVRPIEGYGTTELAPLVSVNVPPKRRLDNFQVDCKEGTVGRPIANVAAKVLDLETGAELGQDSPGMLWIKGPNVMAGYLHQPELTAEVLVDGWYKTGDVALVDGDGFIKITGRMSRFSKIGGEMVPHVTVEEALTNLSGGGDEQMSIAVTAVPDPRKGERLVVLYTSLGKTPEELCKGLSAAGFPNLFIPGLDSFFKVDGLPLLGTGKVDLRGLKDLALKMTAQGK